MKALLKLISRLRPVTNKAILVKRLKLKCSGDGVTEHYSLGYKLNREFTKGQIHIDGQFLDAFWKVSTSSMF